MSSVLPKFAPRNKQQRQIQAYRDVMREEGIMGGKLFGPIPEGHRREFFCLDEHTWVWHEEWTDAKGNHAVTTRYDIRPQGILKSQGTSSYQLVKGAELKNFYKATQMYRDTLYAELMQDQQQAA